MSVCVCILMLGDSAYYEVGTESVKSVLANTDFDVFVVHDEAGRPDVPRDPRVNIHALRHQLPSSHRAHRFLTKFRALSACLSHGRHKWIVQLDADAQFVRPVSERALVGALGGHAMGMVEQKRIVGSEMSRTQFLDHYRQHTLQLLAPDIRAPEPGSFRFFNSGVVIAHRDELAALVRWAVETIDAHVGEFEVGRHMVADQDFFQLWANNLRPRSCVELPWYWNHCEHWDTDFPRLAALVVHFSNFCAGPGDQAVERMRRLRRPRTRLARRFLGPLLARAS